MFDNSPTNPALPPSQDSQATTPAQIPQADNIMSTALNMSTPSVPTSDVSTPPPEPSSAPPTTEMPTDSTAPSTADDTTTNDTANVSDTSDVQAGDSDLLGIKQQALTQLSPLVSHLDQTPVEKFNTLMMMIQASDNQTLIKEAYETAEQISDEKQKAQALLDIVNEINYFTQKKPDNQQ